MKILLMTDIEGVAGVMDMENWCIPDGRYYEAAKRLLTGEVNAAVKGFFRAGAKEILVVDGHGPGGINPELLDERVELARGHFRNPWPFHLDAGFDAVAWVGQHAKAGTPYAHLAHTGTMRVVDFSINGASIGEFGKLAMAAAELGVRAVFGSGDMAFTMEAQALVPGIGTVSVKRGTSPDSGTDLDTKQYARSKVGAIHVHPNRAAQMIEDGARKALTNALGDPLFGIVETVKPPYERVVVFRPDEPGGEKMISVETHADSVIALLNAPLDLKTIS